MVHPPFSSLDLMILYDNNLMIRNENSSVRSMRTNDFSATSLLRYCRKDHLDHAADVVHHWSRVQSTKRSCLLSDKAIGEKRHESWSREKTHCKTTSHASHLPFTIPDYWIPFAHTRPILHL